MRRPLVVAIVLALCWPARTNASNLRTCGNGVVNPGEECAIGAARTSNASAGRAAVTPSTGRAAVTPSTVSLLPNPASISLRCGTTTDVAIHVDQVTNVDGYTFGIVFDHTTVQLAKVVNGSLLSGCFLEASGLTAANATGKLCIGIACGAAKSGTNADLAVITFTGLRVGSSSLTFSSNAGCFSPPPHGCLFETLSGVGSSCSAQNNGAVHVSGAACTPTITPTSTITRTQTVTPTGTPTRVPCVGDCNRNGQVSIDETLTLAGVLLGNTPLPACATGIRNGEPPNVSLLIQAVDNAVYGCRVQPPMSVPTSRYVEIRDGSAESLSGLRDGGGAFRPNRAASKRPTGSRISSGTSHAVASMSQ